jgi:DNA-binding PadR family transcriptional regulator
MFPPSRCYELTLRGTIYYVLRSIPEPALLVLAALVAGPKHGYAIIHEIETQTGKRLGPGTLYGIIARLEQAGLIRPMELEERGRRPYRITPTGKRTFEEQIRALHRYQSALRTLASS